MSTLFPSSPIPHFRGETDVRGIVNIIFGGIMVVGGLSGQLVLRGTDSGGGLAIAGGVIILIGIIRLAMSSRSEE
ncbi:MAG: hypothetical protein KDA88_20825 [Planctomycetaceae bacterium]|nr:hypothetical protein [Planctomycetaceae bacterium]MCB9953496.1 hypothetical protein [Planctomycetaceae bacterium]